MLITKRTVADIPIATPGTPFSILTSVVRLMEARCAAIATRREVNDEERG